MAQLLTPGSILAMTDQAADRLIKLDSGDAALLYLHLLRRGSPEGLRWPEERKRAALKQLQDQGLASLSLTAAQQAEGMTVTVQATRASDAAVNTVSKAAALSPGSSTGYSTVLHVPDCFGSVTTLTAVFELDGQRCTQALARNVSVGENSASWEPLWQAQG